MASCDRRTFAYFALPALAALTLHGCGDTETAGPTTTTTTITTTFACPVGSIPWPQEGSKPRYCQDKENATQEAQQFLKDNMPPWDVDNLQTLEEGILSPTAPLALMARDVFPWAEDVPKTVWQNYVLPYANVNEPRVAWRTLLSPKLAPLVQNPTFEASNISQVLSILNEQLWSVLRPNNSAIHFKKEQTPLIYDPMSVIDYGYASCTGVSILLVDSLRSVGIPARIAGTPAWHGNTSDGNHNWVEVWLGKGKGLNGDDWSFIEGRPAGQGEDLTNPCNKWFCNPSHFDGKTQAFAPTFDRANVSTLAYPMAWDSGNKQIPGVNRTAFYNAACQPCGHTTATATTTSTNTPQQTTTTPTPQHVVV